MAQWGNTDDAANSVLWAVSQLNKTANTANQTDLFGNTTTGAFIAGEVVGQHGVDTTEAANTASDYKKVAHAGWNLKTQGTGPVTALTIVAGGSGYSNNDTIKVVAAGTGAVNATATISTNTTGGITAVTLTNPGAGFTNASVIATYANSTGGSTVAGTSANVVATVGGRAGRTQYETLVAMGSIV